MLTTQIRMQLDSAMRDSSRAVERDILRVALGEIQTAGKGNPVSDETAQNIIRKIIVGIDEILILTGNQSLFKPTYTKETLLEQKSTLEALLPKLWSRDEIEAFFLNQDSPVFEQIQEINHDGKAIGLALKTLKEINAPVSGEDVKAVVEKIRKAE